MPPRPKPPRLWLRPARPGHAATWVILDRGQQISVGADQETAERALQEHLAHKYVRDIRTGKRDPDKIPIADVITVYAQDVAPGHARPRVAGFRLKRIIAFFGERRLSELNGALCRAYVKQSKSEATARRDLEDLKAAIGHHRKEGFHDRIISVWLPPKSLPRERWLTRSEAAKLLWACWRRPQCRHVAKFVLVALYTGRRASVVLSASFERQQGHPWIDLRSGFLRPPERAKVTKKRNPPIPLSEKLLIHLRAWQRNGQRYAVEHHGHPVNQLEALKRVAIDIGLGNNVTPHVLRHTAATWLMQAGVNTFEASRYLGMTVATLERVYGHHAPEHLTDARDFHRAHRQRYANESREQR